MRHKLYGNFFFKTFVKFEGKAIMNKSKTRNRYLKWPSRENFLAWKSVKNLCNNLTKTNKAFWNTINYF